MKDEDLCHRGRHRGRHLATALASPSGLPAGWLQTGDAQTCQGRVVSASSAPSANVFSLDCQPGTVGFST
jgi:hypothetical protein